MSVVLEKKEDLEKEEKDIELEQLDLLTTKEVCQILKLNRYTLYKLVEEKKLHAYKFSNKYMFDRKEVIEFLKKSRL